jgi:hypothetical protein
MSGSAGYGNGPSSTELLLPLFARVDDLLSHPQARDLIIVSSAAAVSLEAGFREQTKPPPQPSPQRNDSDVV